MVIWRSCYQEGLRYLLALGFVLPLVSCSGGDGGIGGIDGVGEGSAILNWVAPSERADNTSLPLSEIAGFRIYYGVETGNYLGRIEVDDPTATQASITNIPSATYFVVMTTIDTDGRESIWSAPELKVSF